jgi:DNA-binding transcriptional MerR regulator/effector-binding domain-containing protein
MFKIGDFAQIGRVSGRQLRHYDRLGLLAPDQVDRDSGYRYYSAGQLPRLNRILALKGLGFSLDQIGTMLDGDVPPEELRGMLTMRKAQVEQALAAELNQLRQIESRIRQIEEQGSLTDYDVVVKSEPARPWLSVRQSCPDMGEAVRLIGQVVRQGVRQLKPRVRDRLTVVAHSAFEDESLDLEAGFTLHEAVNTRVELGGGQLLVLGELPAIEAVASIVRVGPIWQSHLAYGALGIWMEANDYRIAGLCREVFLELPDPAREETVMEIQFPVAKAA